MMNTVNVLDHISVTVSDLERSLAFYRDMLGLKEVERHRLEGETISRMTGKKNVVMQVVRLAAPDTPGVLIDLQQYVYPTGEVSTAKLGDAAHAHFCFGVPDVRQAYQELLAKGVEFISDPVCFDLEWGVVHVVFFKDPDGFILELVQSPIETKTGHSSYGGTE
ncbi:MAG: VOC family protein [candidate division Zixibacteria bacterium]|nr:VOC family protein [candidate division Zixibacteria bacterium]